MRSVIGKARRKATLGFGVSRDAYDEHARQSWRDRLTRPVAPRISAKRWADIRLRAPRLSWRR